MTQANEMNLDLFAQHPIPDPNQGRREELAPGAWILRGFALEAAPNWIGGMERIIADASLRNMVTPGGFTMSVAITNCGRLGWVSDRSGYRYNTHDPETGRPWPMMPAAWERFANRAAAAAEYPEFHPDACLINRYTKGTRMSLHQDRNESDFAAPIVSVSLGLPANFLFGGLERGDSTTQVRLNHGDVVVWGGPTRLNFHGVSPLKAGEHMLLGECRMNLTFRKAG